MPDTFPQQRTQIQRNNVVIKTVFKSYQVYAYSSLKL